MARPRRLSGDVLLWTPPSYRLLAAFFLLVAVSAITFLSLASYSRHETVAGWVVPADGLIRVVATKGGRVVQQPVQEGAMVLYGARLARLETTDAMESGVSSDRIRRSIASQLAAVELQSLASRERLAAEVRGAKAQLARLTEEQMNAQANVELADGQLRLARARKARAMSLLEQGYLSRAGMETAEGAELTAAQALNQARARLTLARQQIDETQTQLAQIPSQAKLSDAQLAESRAALSQRDIGAEAEAGYVILAPAAGQVAALPAKLGQTLPAGGTIAVLSPKDSPLIAELYVPSRASGFLARDQQVQLRYQAFPYQKFGVGRGRITEISSTLLSPNEAPIPGVPLREPVFRVRVELDRTVVGAYGRSMPLRPGMLLTAEITIDRRSLAEWLLDPLYAARRSS